MSKGKGKGKNFSCNDLGQRIKDDAYGTPYSLTRALLDREIFDEPILEPACGEKAMVKVLQECEYENVSFYDLKDGFDFMDEKEQWPSIITNPPRTTLAANRLVSRIACSAWFPSV